MTTRTIHPEVRVLSATTGEVEYIASDQTLDSYREIILSKGWRFDHFAKNAPLVDSHDYYNTSNLLGRVTEFAVRGGRLVNRARFAIDVPSNVKARMAFDMVAAGYLKAVSVGFRPEEFVTQQTPEAWAKAVAAAKLDSETAAKCRCIYITQQQLELSVCILGANPNALVKAYDDGVVKEEQLRALLRADDDLAFVLEAGRAMEQATDAERLLLCDAIARRACVRGARGSGARAPAPPPPHDSPQANATESEAHSGDASDSQRRAEYLLREIQRREILAA